MRRHWKPGLQSRRQPHSPHSSRQQQQQQQQQAWQQAPTFDQLSDATQTHRQDQPADDPMFPIVLKKTTVVICPVCQRRLCPDFTQASFGFVLDRDVDRVLDSSKANRKKLLNIFLRMVNTLLNQGGGLVFIHTSPHLLNFWDEQVDEDLMSLVPDDTLFDENFERHLDEGHVIFRVKPMKHRPLSTLNFQSKISLNKGLKDPTHRQIKRLLARPAPDSPPDLKPEGGPLRSVTHLEDGQRIPFHENFNMQAKVVLPDDLVRRTPRNLDTGSRLVHFWWHHLKLPQYITAFAKQRTGGSFFLGFREEKEVTKTKWTALHNSSGLAGLLQSDMQFWADDKNSEEKQIFHVARESDVPKLERKSGWFICQGIALTPHDMQVVEQQLLKNVQDLLHQPCLNNGNSQDRNPLVKLIFHRVRESQRDHDRDTEEGEGGAAGGIRDEGRGRGGGGGEGAEGERGTGGRGGGARGKWGRKGSQQTDDSQGSSAPGLYVVEARVNYYHGICFQNKTGPEAYKFDHIRNPSKVETTPFQDWVLAQA